MQHNEIPVPLLVTQVLYAGEYNINWEYRNTSGDSLFPQNGGKCTQAAC